MSPETPVHLPQAVPALPLHAAWRWHGGLTAAYASEAGNGRARNEDCCSHVPSGDRPGFCGVADGVGGGAHGEIASSVLLAHCAQAVKETYSDPARLVAWLARADAQVREAIARRTHEAGAATLAAAWFPSQGTAYLLNVGDCRVYRLRPRKEGYAIQQLTEDQTYASLAQRPPPNGNPDDPARMVGAGAVGVPPVVKAQIRARELLLLCSDGVHKFVPDEQIADVVSTGIRDGSSLKTICSALVRAAKRNGSRDDASALLVLRRPWFTRRWAYGCALAAALLLSLLLAHTAFAETQSVIDPVETAEPHKPPPPPKAKPAPRADATLKRERQRAEDEQRMREQAEASAQVAESEATALRVTEQARQAKAAREAAAKAAARKAAAARAAAARAAAEKAAKAKLAAEQAAAKREAAARREAAVREAAARKAAREAAANEAAAREMAAQEAAARETAAREAAARETAAREAAVREAAAKEAAAREAAAREAAAREAAAREAAAREAAAREAATREAAAREAAAREAAAAEARARMRQVFRDCTDCPEVVWLPLGELNLGAPTGAGAPRYPLKMSYMLAVGRFKVTSAEWEACVAAGGCRRRPDDSGWGRARQPVTNVSWEDAQQYVAWLSRKTSKKYRLLTGAEWEYAARAGSEVYDMNGSVSEWVENCFQYRDPRNGGKTWTLECTNQTVRGGAWQGSTNTGRAVARSFVPYNYHDSRIGFRIARTE